MRTVLVLLAVWCGACGSARVPAPPADNAPCVARCDTMHSICANDAWGRHTLVATSLWSLPPAMIDAWLERRALGRCGDALARCYAGCDARARAVTQPRKLISRPTPRARAA